MMALSSVQYLRRGILLHSLFPLRLCSWSLAQGTGRDKQGLQLNLPPSTGAAAPSFKRFWEMCLEKWVQDAYSPSASVHLEDMRPKAPPSPQEGEGLQESLVPGGALEHVVMKAEKP